MADNVGITPGSGAKAASREVSYSGETAQVQVVGLATFDGAHGSVVSSASVWCEHANRLETEFGGDPPWTGCVPA